METGQIFFSDRIDTMTKCKLSIVISIVFSIFMTACAANGSAASVGSYSISEPIPQEEISAAEHSTVSDDETDGSTDSSSELSSPAITENIKSEVASVDDAETEPSLEESAADASDDIDTKKDSSFASAADEASENIASDESNAHTLTIVLDPGHSSKVSGSTEPLGPGSSEIKAADSIGTHGDASGLMEYELNLTVCKKAEAALEQEGYNVILTRQNSDAPISCSERAQIANNAGADAFIRVHANGADASSAHGAMTICITPDNPYTPETYTESSRLSEILLDQYCAATSRRKERVWYTDTMTGNNWSKVPTTLLEMGYMTNADEDIWMASEQGQEQIVTGIVNGINAYFNGNQ